MTNREQEKGRAQRIIGRYREPLATRPNNRLWRCLWQWPILSAIGHSQVLDSIDGQGRNRTNDTRIFSPWNYVPRSFSLSKNPYFIGFFVHVVASCHPKLQLIT